MPGPEIFPPELMVAEKKEEVILLLKRLDIPPQRKKEVFVQWSQMVGAMFTKDDIIKLLGGSWPLI
jgi:hypothetical protein